MKKLLTIGMVLLMSACATRGYEAYCDSFGLPKNGTEYANCKAYYSKMEQWFKGDWNRCESKAALAYPEYLYDHARYGETQSIDRFGNIRHSSIVMEPDYVRNQSLDEERRKIIAPCMAESGWKSPDTWQAGRRDGQTPPKF